MVQKYKKEAYFGVILKKNKKNIAIFFAVSQNRRTFAPVLRTIDCFTVLKSRKKMKKLAFVFAAVVAVSFASCGNKTAQAEAVDSDSVACDTVACDSAVACDSVVADSVVAQ